MLLVGAGGWGSEVGRAIAASPRWSVTALADTDAKTLTAAGAEFHVPPEARFANATEALALHRAHDAVALAVPNPARVPLLLQALAAGKPVFAEKPLVHTPQQLAEVSGAQARHGTPLMVAQNYRFDPHARALRAMIAARSFGALE